MKHKEIQKLNKSELQNLVIELNERVETLKGATDYHIDNSVTLNKRIEELDSILIDNFHAFNKKIDELEKESEKRRIVILETRSLNRQLKKELELKMLHKENSIYIDTLFTIELKKEIKQLYEELRQYKKGN